MVIWTWERYLSFLRLKTNFYSSALAKSLPILPSKKEKKRRTKVINTVFISLGRSVWWYFEPGVWSSMKMIMIIILIGLRLDGTPCYDIKLPTVRNYANCNMQFRTFSRSLMKFTRKWVCKVKTRVNWRIDRLIKKLANPRCCLEYRSHHKTIYVRSWNMASLLKTALIT